MPIPRKYRKRQRWLRIGLASALGLLLIVGLIIAIPLLEREGDNHARVDESGLELLNT